MKHSKWLSLVLRYKVGVLASIVPILVYLLYVGMRMQGGHETEEHEEDSSTDGNALYSVLALGDSLTEGYLVGWSGDQTQIDQSGKQEPFHPYTLHLKELMDADPTWKQGTGREVNIINAGISGDRACLMLPRLRQHVTATKFDLILILAGINDILSAEIPNEQVAETVASSTFDCILNLIQEALGSTTKGLVATMALFPVQRERIEWKNKARERVNQKLRKLQEEKTLGSRWKLVQLSDQDMIASYYDGLHPTPDGYNQFADLLWKQLKTIVSLEQQ